MFIDSRAMIIFVDVKKISRSDLGRRSIEFILKDSRDLEAQEYLTLVIEEVEVID